MESCFSERSKPNPLCKSTYTVDKFLSQLHVGHEESDVRGREQRVKELDADALEEVAAAQLLYVELTEHFAPQDCGVDGQHVLVTRLFAVEVKLEVLKHGVVEAVGHVVHLLERKQVGLLVAQHLGVLVKLDHEHGHSAEDVRRQHDVEQAVDNHEDGLWRARLVKVVVAHRAHKRRDRDVQAVDVAADRRLGLQALTPLQRTADPAAFHEVLQARDQVKDARGPVGAVEHVLQSGKVPHARFHMPGFTCTPAAEGMRCCMSTDGRTAACVMQPLFFQLYCSTRQSMR
eukprot:350136-Chlamydomonas_euryale.AAC.26